MTTLGIDVGGTWLRCVAVKHGRIVARARCAMADSASAMLDALQRIVFDVLHGSETRSPRSPVCLPVSLGLCVPGILHNSQSRLARCVNLPFLEGLDLRSLLHEALSGVARHDTAHGLDHAGLAASAMLMTDADAAAWGVYQQQPDVGAGLVHFRFGTGVAMSWVRNGVIEPLERSPGRHLSLLRVRDSRLSCRCGETGCLEALMDVGPSPVEMERILTQVLSAIDAGLRPGVVVPGGGRWVHDAMLRSAFLRASDTLALTVREDGLGDWAGALGVAMCPVRSS